MCCGCVKALLIPVANTWRGLGRSDPKEVAGGK